MDRLKCIVMDNAKSQIKSGVLRSEHNNYVRRFHIMDAVYE